MTQAQQPSNTVAGHPEPAFRAAWISLQWRAMARTGKGYPRQKAPTRAQQRRDEERAKQAAAGEKAE